MQQGVLVDELYSSYSERHPYIFNLQLLPVVPCKHALRRFKTKQPRPDNLKVTITVHQPDKSCRGDNGRHPVANSILYYRESEKLTTDIVGLITWSQTKYKDVRINPSIHFPS